ncbi:cysteine-rich secretory protein 2-like [Pectinophora gossypiella]|uniref:cysteine-rich secretory protein 2-like n=1 Tax=Pectinophora gossypiella TaxID=13191 RepID=UPI00214E90E0|nr:cysteine-rich secretory protein 2-like [Pectinophora gossypiella]
MVINFVLQHWNAEAAQQAQKYADVCRFVEHNSWKDRIVRNFYSCGQNLFGSREKTDWYTAIESWYSEYVNYTYGSHKNVFEDIGHYTQMMWATSHQVGCGVAFCKGGRWGQFYNFVCHYCPSGNYGMKYPYKIGRPCGDCPYNCVYGKLCTNSCPSLDALGNCEELLVEPDICYTGDCNATCWCRDKIHKNYPWV